MTLMREGRALRIAQEAEKDTRARPETRVRRAESRLVHLLVRTFLACLGFFCAGLPAAAAGRFAALVVDSNTGHVLHAEAADEPRYPASLTKMMTLYLVFEQLEAGRLKPDTRIAISPEAAGTAPSKLGLEPGATISVADAVKALITKSANDIAVALAEHIAGDETRFAQLMTRRARDLGMSATTFRNAHGLPDREQVTTARDMVTLGLRLYDTFPAQARLFALRSFQFGGRNHRNHNTMLDNFAGLEGIKTGYTSASGFNLVASARRDGKHVIAAVLGGASAAARNARMRILLTNGLQRGSSERTRRPLLIAGRPVPRPVPASRPVMRPPPPQVEEPPRLVEPVAAVGRSAVKTTLADARPAAAVPPAPQASRAEVRMAAPIAAGTSVADRLAGGWQPTIAVPTRGVRPPSTLEAQAARLGGVAPDAAPGSRARTDQTRAGSTVVQVGAFAALAEAHQKLDAVRGHAPQLAGAGVATPPVAVKGRRLYRARFTGLDAAAAAAACIELRRHQVDCLVTRDE